MRWVNLSDWNTETVELEVVSILSKISKRPVAHIELTCTLVDDLYVDSIKFMELLVLLEETFSFELGIDDLRPELYHTVADVVRFVQRRVHS
jgi:acyl carrier protein